MADEENRRSNKSELKWTLIKYGIIFGIFIIAGAALQHYVVEPFIGQNLEKTLDSCYSDMNLLNKENVACMKDKETCTTNFTQCNSDYEKLNSEYSSNLDKLIACKKDCNIQ